MRVAPHFLTPPLLHLDSYLITLPKNPILSSPIMSTFPIYHDLVSGTGFPEFPSYSESAEQLSISSTPMHSDQPLYDHQKAADLAVLGILSEDELLAILGLQFQSSVVPGALPLHVGGTTNININIVEESDSVSDVRNDNDNDFTAAIRSKAPHPRVVHACDHCRRRKTKVSTHSNFIYLFYFG